MSFIMIREDITKIKVDAVVNAANTGLLMGGGVCGAIFAAAGPQKLRRACSRLAPIRVGEAAVTPGFALPAKYIIHAAGPVYRRQESGQCERELRAAYASALRLALENGCESIAFPLISSGIYGYPKTEALRTAVSEIRRFLEKHEMAVYLAVLDKTAFAADSGLAAEVGRYLGERYIGRSEVFGAALPVSAKAGAQREEEESREAQDFRAGKIRIPEKVSCEKNAEIPAVVPLEENTGIPEKVLPEGNTRIQEEVLPEENARKPEKVLPEGNTRIREEVLPEKNARRPEKDLLEENAEIPAGVPLEENVRIPGEILLKENARRPEKVPPEENTGRPEKVPHEGNAEISEGVPLEENTGRPEKVLHEGNAEISEGVPPEENTGRPEKVPLEENVRIPGEILLKENARKPEKDPLEENAEIPAGVPIKQNAGILRRFSRDMEDGGQRKEYSPKDVTGKKRSLFASLRTEKGRRNVPGECSSGGRRSVAGKSSAGREAPVPRRLKKTNPAELQELVAALDKPFSEALLHLIDERGYTDAEVYRRANLDRRLFSKIRTNSAYMPSKRTAIALAVALQLNLSETRELLARAGYALSHSQKFDVIVEYFIVNGKYDLYEINEILFQYDQPLLGGEK